MQAQQDKLTLTLMRLEPVEKHLEAAKKELHQATWFLSFKAAMPEDVFDYSPFVGGITR